MRLSPARVSAEGRLLGGRAQALTKLGDEADKAEAGREARGHSPQAQPSGARTCPRASPHFQAPKVEQNTAPVWAMDCLPMRHL